MRIAILNRVSLSYAPYSKWLQSQKPEIVLFTSLERWKSNSEDEAEVQREYSAHECIENYDLGGLADLRLLCHAKKNTFDRIIAVSEYDLIRAARLREKIQIPGQSIESAIAFRDKYKMKSLAKENGVPVPDFASVESPLDLIEFIDIHSFPVVVKPREGAGAVNTQVIRNEEELNQYLKNGLSPVLELPPGLIVETFVPGKMYHIDGLVNNGRILLSWPSVYINGCLAFQSGEFLGGCLLEPEDPMVIRLNDFVAKVLKALPTPETCSFHAEVFHTPDDQLIFCEIASRTGGGKILEMIELSFGLNLTQAWVLLECGNKIDELMYSNIPKVQAGYLMIPPRTGRLISVPIDCDLPGVQLYKPTPKVGTRFELGKTNAEQIASFVVTGRSHAEVKKRIIFVANWFNETCVWEN